MFEIKQLTAAEERAYEGFIGRPEFSSVQHTLNWRNAVLDMGKDSPYFIVAKRDNEIVGVLPLYYYKCKFGDILTSIAWDTNSSICSTDAICREIYRGLFDSALTLAKRLGCVALSVSTNPFIDDKQCCLERFRPDYIMENFIQYIPMNEIFDENGSIKHPNYVKRTNLSRNLEKAKQQSIVISDDQTENNVDECFRIYEKRMNEVGGSCVPKEFFHKILTNLTRKGKGKFLSAFHEGKMIATCLFLQTRAMIDVHMLSMDSEYSRTGVNYLFTDYMLRWAQKNGIPIFNWMSSPRRSDGVYRWKEQWGSHDGTLLYLTRILGDISQWESMNLQELSEAYKFHYLLPFNLLRKSGSKFTSKDELTAFLQSCQERQETVIELPNCVRSS